MGTMSINKNHAKAKETAKTLLEALPYIQQFSNEYIVIKLGGSVLLEEQLKTSFAVGITLCRYVGMKPIVVHGGGKEISKWMEKVGKKATFLDGLRVTDDETMELTEMVVSGKVNSDVVSAINQSGGKAIGLSGRSANIFSAVKLEKEDVDLGRVGKIKEVNPLLLMSLADQGYIPVISPVSSDTLGESLNLNADNVASHIAQALKAKKLIYLTDVDGLKIENTLVKRINIEEAKSFLDHSDVAGGMLPKLKYAIKAIEGSVSQVHMINGNTEHAVLLELLTVGGVGTLIEAS